MAKLYVKSAQERRRTRIRARVRGVSGRPRLSVFRSLNHIYAQVIDDSAGHTLTSASTLDAEVREKMTVKTKDAELIGTLIAQRALDKGISRVVFDRGGCKYHGRIKALAEAARKGGLEF